MLSLLDAINRRFNASSRGLALLLPVRILVPVRAGEDPGQDRVQFNRNLIPTVSM